MLLHLFLQGGRLHCFQARIGIALQLQHSLLVYPIRVSAPLSEWLIPLRARWRYFEAAHFSSANVLALIIP